MTRQQVRQERTWGADTAVEQLYAAHWRSLVRLGVLLVGDVGIAEEVVQDAFISVHRRWHKLRDPDRALAYLRQSVVNGARSTLRHRSVVERHARRVGPEIVARTAESADTAALEQSAEQARRRTVLDALAALPRRQREVLALRYYLELSEGEIAASLGISRGAVKSHASRGSATLRRSLSSVWKDES